MSEVTPYRMASWRYIARRDLLETQDRLRPTVAPPPMCIQRKAELESAMDDLGEFGVRFNVVAKKAAAREMT